MASLAVGSAPPLQQENRLDNVRFAEGLLDRGLFELLDHFLKQHQPADPIEAQLLARIAKLRLNQDEDVPLGDRAAALREATASLRDLIASHAGDARVDQWRLQLGYDLLYRLAEPHCNNVLYGLDDAHDRRELAMLATEADELFTQAAKESPSQQASSQPVRRRTDALLSGSVEVRQIRLRAGYFHAWARLYRVLASVQRAAADNAVLSEIVEYANASGYLDAPHEQTGVQAQTLLLAGIAHRLLGQHAEAGRLLDQAIGFVQEAAGSPGQQPLLWVANVARLEQIRTLRDAGRFDEAARACAELGNWVRISGQRDGIGMSLAVALAESDVYTRQAEAISDWASAEKLRRRARSVLIELTRSDPRAADTLYGLLYRRMVDKPPEGMDAFDKVVMIAGLMADKQFDRARPMAEDLLREDSWLSREFLPEIRFNLAVCRFEGGDRLGAVDSFAEVAQQHPDFARAQTAAEYAVRIAADLFADPALRGRRDVRESFLQALELLTSRFPDSPEVAKRYYDLGYVLQLMGRFDEAAEAFERVGVEDDRLLDAKYWAVVCRFEAARLEQEGGSPAGKPYRDAIEAAERFVRRVQADAANQTDPKQSARARPLVSDVLLRAASTLAQPPLNDPQAALRMLDRIEQDAGTEAAWLGRALQIRIVALQSLGRLQDAQKVVDELLATDELRAGMVLAGLLEAMLEQHESSESDRSAEARRQEMLTLADKLAKWAQRRREQLTVEQRLRIQVPVARAYQQGGRVTEALTAFNDAAELDRQVTARIESDGNLANSDVLAGQAECLYQLGRYRQALQIYQGQIHRRAMPNTPLWWKAYLRSLQCHAKLSAARAAASADEDTRQSLQQILNSIAVQRRIDPKLGGPDLRSEFNQLETEVKEVLARR
ncbi:MAG TPA: tetratricopeptide repeat protein [Phycisphaerae bacterium]|nr:tetratricopeptide repeat protein [Phycisphaerae bacterium]